MQTSTYQEPTGDPRNYAGSESSQARSPLTNLPLLGKLASEKKTRDGQAPKKRGPKPDSKPALTRRQELNRQAQRTHRERKEMYIKALEQEVLRLKEVFTTTTKERDAALEENRRLKELLVSHGISLNSIPGAETLGLIDNQYAPSSSGSISGSYPTGSSNGGLSPMPQYNNQGSPTYTGQQQPVTTRNLATLPNTGLDYDQIGIDFVLTLERPCMDHMQMLMVRSDESLLANSSALDSGQDDVPDVHISGHVLMATCPPESHILGKPKEQYPHKMPEMGMTDLRKLLDLSNRLPLDAEITPIMAWTIIMCSPSLAKLTKLDIETIRDDLVGKVRCYGFGAVLEEFEVHDALSNVLAGKPSNM